MQVAPAQDFRGTLAWVERDGIHVLTEDTGATRAIPAPAGAQEVRLSGDGRWLAWQDASGSNNALWAAPTRDGGSRRVADHVAGWEWASQGDTLAYATDSGDGVAYLPDQPASAYAIAPGWRIGSPVWGPDGRRLAFVIVDETTRPPSDELWVVDVGDPIQQHCAPRCAGQPRRLTAEASSRLEIVGWSPDGAALLAMVDPQRSASLAADGLPLVRVDVRTGAVVQLVPAVITPSWVQWSPDGRTLLVAAGGGRFINDPRHLETCAGGLPPCTVVSPPSILALDPAWSPLGDRIAWVSAPIGPNSSVVNGHPELWYRSRRLAISRPDGSDMTTIDAAGNGVAFPVWSIDGTHLLFVRDNSVRLFDLASRSSAQLTGTLELPGGGTPDRSIMAATTATWRAVIDWRAPCC